MLRQFIKRRMAPRRIWQAVLATIFLGVIYGCLPGMETAIARTWLEALLSRLR